MNKLQKSNQMGFAHLVLIMVAAAVIIAVGLVGSYVISKSDAAAAISVPIPISKIIDTNGPSTHAGDEWQSKNAVDWRIPVGTPVKAIRAGIVANAFGCSSSTRCNDPSYVLAGRRINLKTAGGVGFAYYTHLSKTTVKPGDKVVAGQIIGYSGTANNVPHLHFALNPNVYGQGNACKYVRERWKICPAKWD